MQGLKNCLRTAARHDIHNITVPLLLVHGMQPVCDMGGGGVSGVSVGMGGVCGVCMRVCVVCEACVGVWVCACMCIIVYVWHV